MSKHHPPQGKCFLCGRGDDVPTIRDSTVCKAEKECRDSCGKSIQRKPRGNVVHNFLKTMNRLFDSCRGICGDDDDDDDNDDSDDHDNKVRGAVAGLDPGFCPACGRGNVGYGWFDSDSDSDTESDSDTGTSSSLRHVQFADEARRGCTPYRLLLTDDYVYVRPSLIEWDVRLIPSKKEIYPTDEIRKKSFFTKADVDRAKRDMTHDRLVRREYQLIMHQLAVEHAKERHRRGRRKSR